MPKPDNTGQGSNPRELGINAIGSNGQFAHSYETPDGAKVTKIVGNPPYSAKEFYDNKEAADAARRQLIADQAKDRGPEYYDQFKPPEDRESSPPPPAAPAEMITEVPPSLGQTPPTGNLRAVGDIIEVPDHLRPVAEAVEPAPQVVINPMPGELPPSPPAPERPDMIGPPPQ